MPPGVRLPHIHDHVGTAEIALEALGATVQHEVTAHLNSAHLLTMDQPSDSNDESSIKPVSSLRSRFESLGRDQSLTGPSTLGGRATTFYTPSGQTAPSVSAVSGTSIKTLKNGPSTTSNGPSAKFELQHETPKVERPRSVLLATPSQSVPPLVTVESPLSPDRNTSVDLRSARTIPGWDGLSLSRPGIPALESRMAALLQGPHAPKAVSEGAASTQTTPEMRPRSQAGSVPPPVNRAGKPQVPMKPLNLAGRSENSSVLVAEPESIDRSISPFGTPPGSGNSSPAARHYSQIHYVPRDPLASGAESVRSGSEASFVEHIRTDSISSVSTRGRDDSDVSFASRSRTDSNASYIESSSLPKTSSYPRSLQSHAMTATRQTVNGASSTTRHRTISSDDNTAVGDASENVEGPPRLPARPELQIRPGRTSPPKQRTGRTSPVKKIFETRHGTNGSKRGVIMDQRTIPSSREMPVQKATSRSALTLGFSQAAASPTATSSHKATSMPEPRRPVPRRPPSPMHQSPVKPATDLAKLDGQSRDREEPLLAPESSKGQFAGASEYPDPTSSSRRLPKYRQRPWHISTDYDTKLFAVCGENVCTTGNRTKAWNLRTGQLLMDLEHHDILRATSIVFKPSTQSEHEGRRIWLGTSSGEIHEVDILSQKVIASEPNAHRRREIIRIYRYASELWTLDDNGDLNVWGPEQRGMPSLDARPKTFHTTRGHTYSIAVGRQLWIATGKEIRVFAPSADSDTDFQLVRSSLSQHGTGEVHSGTTISARPGLVYFGHQDGKVSVYDCNDFSCTAVVNVSIYKLSSLAGVGDYLWTGFNTGMIYVYDTSVTPWQVKKDWQAHEKQVCGISAEHSALWKLDRLQVVSLGTDNTLRIWDGALEEDWLASRMRELDDQYCSFYEIKASVLTWNVGACKPSTLSYSGEDNNFLWEYLADNSSSDIFVFGFQELVDLEDKKLTAKSLFKSRRKETNDQDYVGHQYRAWRDYLTRCLNDCMPSSEPYVVLHTASLVGLFTCVFVKASLRSRIKHVHATEVKRGMSGMYGNKGALVLRMVLDDSSLW